MTYPADSPNPNKGERAFTLIEVSVLIFLLALFMFIAMPRFQDITEANTKSASRTLTILVRQLYNEAVFKNRTYKLAFDIDGGQYWVEVLSGNEFVVPANPSLGKKRLPAGVSFKDILTERTYGSGLGLRSEFILFFPTGYVEPAVIYLESENGKEYTLETIPYTGGTRVYDKYVDLKRGGR